uniref:Uncharacterized protein n=1 Tax=Glossina brevipalpis TaxID=37001 RepID=A0A1A9VZV4_9MUSC
MKFFNGFLILMLWLLAVVSTALNDIGTTIENTQKTTLSQPFENTTVQTEAWLLTAKSAPGYPPVEGLIRCDEYYPPNGFPYDDYGDYYTAMEPVYYQYPSFVSPCYG